MKNKWLSIDGHVWVNTEKLRHAWIRKVNDTNYLVLGQFDNDDDVVLSPIFDNALDCMKWFRDNIE